jgi:hypothetical protein
MRRKIEQMQGEVNEFMDYVKRELARGIDDWEQRLGTALVKSSPTDLVRRTIRLRLTPKQKNQKLRSNHRLPSVVPCPICDDTGWKTIDVTVLIGSHAASAGISAASNRC